MNNKIIMLSSEHLEECTKLYTYVFNKEPWNDGWEEEDAREGQAEEFYKRNGFYVSPRMIVMLQRLES